VITNKSTKTTIAKDYKICSSLFSKARGLMFSKKRNLIFDFDEERRISLHMLFVFFPIWAVYLNKNKAEYILELTEKPKIEIGDKIDW